MTKAGNNLIVFDWNGTLLADTSACLRAANAVLGHLGVPHATMVQYRKHYTMPIKHLYQALGADSEKLEARLHEITPLFHNTYGAAAIRLRRGAKAMLAHMHSVYCAPIILSNYVKPRIDEQARKLGIRAHFDEIIAFEVGDATFRQRGKGARLQEYLRTRPHCGALIVGDSEEEIEIGRELGMTTVAITDGMCSTARLRAMRPDFMVGSLSQLPAIAHKIFGATPQEPS